jgi:chaperonin cofactor prefoldin
MFELYGFMLGAGTVGLLFGGYWLWNKMDGIHKNLLDTFYTRTDDLDKRLYELREHSTKFNIRLTDLEKSTDPSDRRIEDLERNVQDQFSDLDRRTEDLERNVQDQYSDLERNIQDQYREVQLNIENAVNDISTTSDALRKEFDSRITGEVRNIQRMLQRKLEESDVQA